MSVLVGLVILTLAGVLWLRRRVLVVAVKGRSMQPALLDGDRVLVWRRPVRRVKRGDMVVLVGPNATVVSTTTLVVSGVRRTMTRTRS